MSLSELRRGQWAEVSEIPDESLRIQLLRFGVVPGCRVQCHSRIPLGPMVMQFGGQEIALGRKAADGVQVRCDEPSCGRNGRRRGWRKSQ